MEIGDLIYIIILLLFMILGFFNDSRKKKEKQQMDSASQPDINPQRQPSTSKLSPPQVPGKLKSKYELEQEEETQRHKKRESEKQIKEGKILFQSSLGQLTDFSKESSLKGTAMSFETDSTYDEKSLYETDDDAISLYDMDLDSPEMPEVLDEEQNIVHPVVSDLLGPDNKKELAKGIIYGEIFQRKY